MADVKITELPPVDLPLVGNEVFAAVQNGFTMKVTTDDIAAFAGNAGATWGGISGVMADQLDLSAALNARLTDAPSDNVGYVRKDGSWVAESAGISDAPVDGNLYGRKDSGWAQIATSGTGDVIGPALSAPDNIAVFDGASGKILKDGGYTIAQLRGLALTSPENVQTGTAYTLVLADAFKLVTMSNSAANTITVPPDSSVAFPVGTRVDLGQDGAGQTTIVAGSGVTIRTPETLRMRKQWGKATLIKRAANTWDVEGNLEAVS